MSHNRLQTAGMAIKCSHNRILSTKTFLYKLITALLFVFLPLFSGKVLVDAKCANFEFKFEYLFFSSVSILCIFVD